MKHSLHSLIALLLSSGVSTAAVSINEIRIDQPSTDNDEFIEFFTTDASESLADHWMLAIGDSGQTDFGVVESVLDLTGNTSSLNYFVVAESTFTLGAANLTASLNFENSDNVTFLLVKDFTGANGDDLDTDDDGTLDSTPWSSIIDGVSLVETADGTGDKFYAPGLGLPSIGPDGTFVPGHVYKDSATGAWTIGAFDPGADTPGGLNPAIPEPSSGLLALLGGAVWFLRRSRR